MQIDNRKRVAYLRLDNVELINLLLAIQNMKGGIPFTQLRMEERMLISALLDIDLGREGKYTLGIEGILNGDL